MARKATRRCAATIAGACSITLAAAACSTPPPAGRTWNFSVASVTVDDQTEYSPPLGGIFGNRPVDCCDEPYVVNVWFRLRLSTDGRSSSADAGVVHNRGAVGGLADGFHGGGTTYPSTKAPATPAAAATVSFPNLTRVDLGDLALGQPLEVVGLYTWAAEADLISLVPTAGSLARIIDTTLGDVIANQALPSDPQDIARLIGRIIGDGFTLVGNAVLTSIPELPDDILGGNVYAFVGAKGALGSVLNSAFPLVERLLPVPIELPSIVPSITTIELRALTGSYEAPNQRFADLPGAAHTYTFRMAPA